MKGHLTGHPQMHAGHTKLWGCQGFLDHPECNVDRIARSCRCGAAGATSTQLQPHPSDAAAIITAATGGNCARRYFVGRRTDASCALATLIIALCFLFVGPLEVLGVDGGTKVR